MRADPVRDRSAIKGLRSAVQAAIDRADDGFPDGLGELPQDEERLVVATGRYIGEGFDDSRLDTLFLAMPVSWKGTLVQYAGRLHRLHEGKTEVRIYDYVDEKVAVLRRMFERRMRGYSALGYEIDRDPNSSPGEGFRAHEAEEQVDLDFTRDV